MSNNVPCRCESQDAARKHWRVRQRKCNHSAFAGGRYTPSEYSEVTCLQCQGSWRTKAAYVDELPDYYL